MIKSMVIFKTFGYLDIVTYSKVHNKKMVTVKQKTILCEKEQFLVKQKH